MSTTSKIEVICGVSFTKHDGVTTRTVQKVELVTAPLNIANIVKAKAMNDAQLNQAALQVANGIIYPEFSATAILGHRSAKGWQTVNKLAAVVKAIGGDTKKAAQLAKAVADAIEKAERKISVNCDSVHTAAKACGLIETKAKANTEEANTELTPADKNNLLAMVAANAAKFPLTAFLDAYTDAAITAGVMTIAQSKAMKAARNTK